MCLLFVDNVPHNVHMPKQMSVENAVLHKAIVDNGRYVSLASRNHNQYTLAANSHEPLYGMARNNCYSTVGSSLETSSGFLLFPSFKRCFTQTKQFVIQLRQRIFIRENCLKHTSLCQLIR